MDRPTPPCSPSPPHPAPQYVVGASTLLTELPGPAARALDQFQRLVYRLLGSKGGYLVEGDDGLVLAAFASSSAAVEWALDCVSGLKKLVSRAAESTRSCVTRGALP